MLRRMFKHDFIHVWILIFVSLTNEVCTVINMLKGSEKVSRF